MKLLTHTSLFMVTMSMIVFFLCGVSFYFVFKKISADRLEKELRHEMVQILKDPQLFMAAVNAEVPFFDRIEFRFPDSSEQVSVQFFDSLMFANDQQSFVPVRYIRFAARIENDLIEFRIYKSTISSDELTERIAGLIIIMAILFSMGMYFLNRYVFSQTWSGFYKSLRKVQFFKAGEQIPEFGENEIDEFEDLNSELSKMTRRISADYHNLKAFTSHATHEFQTPLAVIISKADLLMQNENYSEVQFEQLQSIQQYARQLSRMTQALSLLFKIDNQQFAELKLVNVSDIINRHLALVREQCELRGIKVELSLATDIQFEMHPDLADILILNLLRNAMNHNCEEGMIRIENLESTLIISNTGQESALDQNLIFNEFIKGEDSSGLGLGLSIARKITNIYHIGLLYKFDNQLHIFALNFEPIKVS